MPRGKPRSKYPDLYKDPEQTRWEILGPGGFRVDAQSHVFNFNAPNYDWNVQQLGAVNRAACTWGGFYDPGVPIRTRAKGDYMLFQAIPLPAQSVHTAPDIPNNVYIGTPLDQSSFVYLIKRIQFNLLFPGYWQGDHGNSPAGANFMGQSWLKFHCMSRGECMQYSNTLRFVEGTTTARNNPILDAPKDADLNAPRIDSCYMVQPRGALGGSTTQSNHSVPGYDSSWLTSNLGNTSSASTSSFYPFARKGPRHEFNHEQPLDTVLGGISSGSSSFIPLVDSEPNYLIQRDRWMFCSFAPPVICANAEITPGANVFSKMWYTLRLELLYAPSIEDLIPYFNVR